MRTSTDICLLCNIDPSTKANSHILPKFLSKKLFGPQKAKRGFQISSEHKREKPPKVVQDSPKEDYILCPDCEMYLSVLESISSDTFINWKSKIIGGDFIQNKVHDEFSIVECNSSNKSAIRLFLYSIFWRASISNHILFNNFAITKDLEEELRLSLLSHKATKHNDLLNILNRNLTFTLFPIAIITADTFKSDTSNILFVPPYNKSYSLVIDQFSFILFKSVSEIPVDFFKPTSNTKVNDCRIIVFSQEGWSDTIIQPVIDLMAKAMLGNEQKKSGS